MSVDRRTFLLATSAVCWARGDDTPAIPRTGRDNADLASFDQLMDRFVRENKVPGASLAVTKDRRLVYARGFGLADTSACEPVQPTSTFRIASVSKPITAVAILQLVEEGKLKLDEPVLERIDLGPLKLTDDRWKKITVRHCLQHSGGWDRDASGDPIGRSRTIAQSLRVPLPVGPNDIVRHMAGEKLDFDPGSRFAYSNLGYLVLGRIIETISRQSYESFVRQHVMGRIGVVSARLGKALERDRFKDEVKYYDSRKRTGKALYPPLLNRDVPIHYGAENFEAYGAHGGWIASAVDLVRFASAFSEITSSPLLREDAIRTMWQSPEFPPRKPSVRSSYYGLGWMVRTVRFMGVVNAFHSGFIAGSEAIMVRRHDGLCWAVLFNTASSPDGKSLTGLIDAQVHRAADAVKRWPQDDQFTDHR